LKIINEQKDLEKLREVSSKQEKIRMANFRISLRVRDTRLPTWKPKSTVGKCNWTERCGQHAGGCSWYKTRGKV